MQNKAKRYLIPFTALLLLLCGWVLASCRPVPGPPAPVLPAVQPPPAESQPPEQLPPVAQAADGEEWKTVEIFTGQDSETTLPFQVSGVRWRITWAADAEYPGYALFDLFVYPKGSHSLPTKRISHSGDSTGDTVYVSEGGQSYYFKVIAANLRSWTIAVQEHAGEASVSPFQITRIYYKGRDYLMRDIVWYQKVGSEAIYDYHPIVEADGYVSIHYPIVEGDEYVEIKNQSDSWQDIGDWVLKNVTKGYPSFIFPSLSPANFEYCALPTCVHPGEIHPEHCVPPTHCLIAPHHSIRVYTGEVHPESGGFRFHYPPGDIWDNENPDMAALYDCMGQEVSRHTYMVLAEDEVTACE